MPQLRRRMGLVLRLILPLVLLMPAVARGDKLVLQDGSTVAGHVIAETDTHVTLDIARPGVASSMTRRVAKAQIKTWYRPPREGPAYIMLPIIGEIGVDVTAEALEAGLKEARLARPKYIVLAIDSPGGQIAHMMRIIHLLVEAQKETPVIAYVNKAYSAAAVISLSCQRIYLRPGAAIGATVPFRVLESGPTDVDAKFRSIIEAHMRAVAAHGGHADLLIRGMSEIDLEIILSHDDQGRPHLSTAGEGRAIKSKGQVLTLTADEAAACGLATVAPDISTVATDIVKGPWHEPHRRAWNTVLHTASRQQQQQRELAEINRRRVQRVVIIQQIKPEMDRIAEKSAALIGKMTAAGNAIKELRQQYERDAERINAQHKRDAQAASIQHNPMVGMNRAKSEANERLAALHKTFLAAVAPHQSELDSARAELQLLRTRHDQLLASIPPE